MPSLNCCGPTCSPQKNGIWTSKEEATKHPFDNIACVIVNKDTFVVPDWRLCVFNSTFVWCCPKCVAYVKEVEDATTR